MESDGLELALQDPRHRRFCGTKYERFVKPRIDRWLSALLLILLAPTLPLTALAIRLESGGPAFFVQRRVGRYGSKFGVIRFRTVDARSELWRRSLRNEPVDVPANSPDLTRIGRFLLNSRLDRLPMLINVFRGEMSFVGPRAALPYELERYGAVDWLRLRMKPGSHASGGSVACPSLTFGRPLPSTRSTSTTSRWRLIFILSCAPSRRS